MNQVQFTDRSDGTDTMFANEADLKALGMTWDVRGDAVRLGQCV